ncbi:uncharacterized protein YndB with AHSA1/START domain [Chitinophaga polysaccharea]|uniref:Uncharacterized protein YndB with AHSA1/START domain n=1 Tax=Chitinophaga polysaccharea TaxID=1293035 RepID=A0A561PRJ3_9BACT|nr:SRPBCC family protein [Chitinophaga polysaccharea]TWF40711.1 uncharacterized protein YndB with AHSA1/START domain [Chitinophaga polysaccharea]
MSLSTHSSETSRIIKAPREAVYNAFIDPIAVAAWLAPDNMRAEIHHFDARENGIFRMSLTYLDPAQSLPGKTTADKDMFQGRFATLTPFEKIVEIIVFDSADEKYAGEMTMTVTLADVADGTLVNLHFDNIPPGIRPEDNDEGSRQSLRKLATLLE